MLMFIRFLESLMSDSLAFGPLEFGGSLTDFRFKID